MLNLASCDMKAANDYRHGSDRRTEVFTLHYHVLLIPLQLFIAHLSQPVLQVVFVFTGLKSILLPFGIPKTTPFLVYLLRTRLTDILYSYSDILVLCLCSPSLLMHCPDCDSGTLLLFLLHSVRHLFYWTSQNPLLFYQSVNQKPMPHICPIAVPVHGI